MTHRTRILERMPNAQAEVYREMLLDAGLDAEIVPSDLPGMSVQLTVPDAQAERAEAFLAQGAPPDAEPRVCPSCGEKNPALFGECWSCGARFDGGDTEPRPSVDDEPKRATGATLAYVLLVVLLMWLAMRYLF